MAYSNIPTLSDLQARLQVTQVSINNVQKSGSSLISTFLSTPNSEAAWNNMNTVIQTFLARDSSLYPSLRVLITISDGRVAYDSSKGANNTFARYQSGLINENHNTRVAIMVALLGNSGVGNEDKFSTSTGINESYNALRMGLSTSNALGCSRVSVNSDD
jgi:hypothetical protein